MSKPYKFKTLSIVNQGNDQKQGKDDELTVFTTGAGKTIDLLFKDGTRQCFNYSHLVTISYENEKQEDKSKSDQLTLDGQGDNSSVDFTTNTQNNRIIKLTFSTHTVTIKGYCLEPLYNHLINHNIKSITEHDKRYLSMVEDGGAFVKEIKIENLENVLNL
jgi:hypothetical protein